MTVLDWLTTSKFIDLMSVIYLCIKRGETQETSQHLA